MTREQIISAYPLDRFLKERGYDLRRAGVNFVTNACPVKQHKKYHRPVTIDRDKNLWHCNDCKHGGSVIDWVMLEQNVTASDAMGLLGSGNNGSSELVATYNYTDESGSLLYQTCRYQPKNFSQRRPDGKGGWINNLQGVRRVLYRLPEVIAAQTVCVAEGEKDCDNLAKLGFVATTNPMGAGKWREEYSETLRGKDVIVFGDVGDDDGAGDRHSEQVIESLAGKAKSIKQVALPDGFHDVFDYIASLPHVTAQDTIGKLIQKTPEIGLAIAESSNDAESDEIQRRSPAPYVPPPLALLPSQLQDYIHAAAESLNVDVAYILLPLLSSLGAAVGNSRSILLKRGFIQPPVIWTGIIGRSGSRKSPALEAGCFGVMKHERELMQQNSHAREHYENDLAEWQSKKSKERGLKPEPPKILTCVTDDLTIEALADLLITNARGVLNRKDELAHLFGSFDQYKSHAKGSDVSRYLSLHNGFFVAVDRRSDNRHHRILHPRACITGGIQPKILRRVLTTEFFERGLPARFLFGYPPFHQDKWSEATVPEDLCDAALNLFDELWLLQPEHDENGHPKPSLLRLDNEAKNVFTRFYDECGAASAEAGEHEEAVWCKLTGYAARLALAAQLAHDPQSQSVTGNTMRAACTLARWFGNEACRIYAELAETRDKWEQRELREFIERRGGAVSEREVMQSFTLLKNDKSGTQRALNALIAAGRGKWEPIGTTDKGGRPTRKFRLLPTSTSTKPPALRGKTGGCVDVDAAKYHNNEASGESDIEAVSDGLDPMPEGILEL